MFGSLVGFACVNDLSTTPVNLPRLIFKQPSPYSYLMNAARQIIAGIQAL
jgi:hypothetical protein